LMSEMENNGQSRSVFAMSHYSVQGVFAPLSFLASHRNGILVAIGVVIIRIKVNAETG
jgi:hypothetical protein